MVSDASRFSPKNLLLVVLVLVVSIYFGLTVGRFLGNFSEVKVVSENKAPVFGLPQVSPSPISSWSGTIRRVVAADVETDGDFELVGESEKIIAILKSNKIDLRISEGMAVTVEGRKVKVYGNNLPLILVERIKFK